MLPGKAIAKRWSASSPSVSLTFDATRSRNVPGRAMPTMPSRKRSGWSISASAPCAPSHRFQLGCSRSSGASAIAYRPDPELRQDLIAAIHSLPDKYRDVIVLRDIQEFSIGEISVELLLTREAVKSRIHRARLMIREYLED